MKGIDYINRKISTDKQLNIKLVERVNKFYWKHGVKEKLSTLQEKSVYIKYIGSINISYYKIKRYILKLIKIIKAIPTSTKFRPETKVQKIILKKEELKKLLAKKNELSTFYYNENLRYGRYPRISKTDSKISEES